jgi:glycosyltransferase involved in cell wall biosynthesis
MLLCQKVSSTGSGVVVKETVERAASLNTDVSLVCGGYAGDEPLQSFRSRPKRLTLVEFDSKPPLGIPMPIAGMSNRMPYRSIAFKDLTLNQVELYVAVWMRHIREALASFKPHVIHVHHLWLLAAAAAHVAPPDVPILVSLHGTDLSRADDAPHLAQLVEPSIARFDNLLALSDDMVASTVAHYPASTSDVIAVLGNGFNETLFKPGRHTRAVLEQYGIDPAGRPVALFVGKFDRVKGIEWLLRAFARVVGTSLLVVGGGGPDDELQRYQGLVSALKLEHRVVFTGAIPYEDVGALMNAASVLVLPSFHEAFGLVALEALACGSRLVATRQGGLSSFVPTVLQNEGDAILIDGLPSLAPEPNDSSRFVSDLADAIDTQLSKPLPFDRRKAIAQSVTHLTWAVYTERLARLYHALWGQ